MLPLRSFVLNAVISGSLSGVGSEVGFDVTFGVAVGVDPLGVVLAAVCPPLLGSTVLSGASDGEVCTSSGVADSSGAPVSSPFVPDGVAASGVGSVDDGSLLHPATITRARANIRAINVLNFFMSTPQKFYSSAIKIALL